MQGLPIEPIVSHPLVTDIAALARTVAAAPMSAVCLLDAEENWHAAVDGFEADQTPFVVAAAAVARSELFVIDASVTDDELVDDANVGRLGVSSAAVVPIASPDGDVIGCLCVLDSSRRTFSKSQLDDLGALTRQVERHVDRAVEQHHLRDLSVRLVESERVLSETLTRLEMSNRDLEHFAYHAAHELQAPLSAVAAFASLIDDALAGELDPKLLSMSARHVQTESTRLGARVASLFELSQFSNSELSHGAVLITPLLDDVAQWFDNTIGSIEVDCDADLSVFGDPIALHTLLTNLVSNAQRYRSPDRTLYVRIAARTNGDKVTIAVADNGIGIKTDDLDRIFEAFQRVDGSTPGAGVGLAMCRRIAERLGGTISVTSAVDEGSTFTVALPAG